MMEVPSSITTKPISYCLANAGLRLQDVDTFAFNIQALTPGYCGLSQPVAAKQFCSFNPFGEKSLYVSHHLAHALAGFSGSYCDQATVVVADGSGGVTVGADDLLLDGKSLWTYLNGPYPQERPALHAFSVYKFSQNGFHLKYREYAPSFNNS